MGPLPERAAVGNRPGGLQRGRRRLELLHARSGPLPRLPLGRGRPGGDLRRQAAALLRARAVEREGPHPEGAGLRPVEQRGEPRRGREGLLLLPRQHPDPFVHEVPLQVPAGRLPLRRPGPDEREADAGGDGVRAPRHRRLRGRPLLRRLRGVRQGRHRRHPREDHGGEPGPGGGRAASPPDAVVPQRLVVVDREPGEEADARADPGARGDEHRRGLASTPRGLHAALRGGRPAALHRERDEQRAAVPGKQEREQVRQGRHRRPGGAWQAGRREPGEGGNQGRGPLPSVCRSRRHRDRAAAPRGIQGRRQPLRRLRPDPRGAARRSGRVLRRRDPLVGVPRRRPRDAPGAGRDALEQAVLLLRRGPVVEGAPREPPAAREQAVPEPGLVPHAERGHHLDARQVGVPLVRGVGFWPSTRFRSPWWTPTSRSSRWS